MKQNTDISKWLEAGNIVLKGNSPKYSSSGTSRFKMKDVKDQYNPSAYGPKPKKTIIKQRGSLI